MSRVLISAGPMYGHYYPLVPVAWALRAAGHEVLVATPADFTAAVLGTGLPVFPVASAVDVGRMLGFDRQGNPVPRPPERAGWMRRSGRGWGRLAAHTLPGMLALVDRWRPDVLICDPAEYAGPIAAARHGVPWVEHGWGVALPADFRSAAAEELAGELAQAGLPGFPEPALVLDSCPAALRPPGTTGQPSVRYVPFNGPAEVPPWLNEPRTRTRVCVTLGSVVPAKLGPESLAVLLADLSGLGAEMVVAAPPDVVARLAPHPQVRTAGWLPMSLVLPSCDVVVHHGGSGTMMTALVYGVPQLLLPRPVADQLNNAERLAGSGAGVAIPADDATADDLRTSVTRLVGDPAYRDRAGQVATQIAAAPAPTEVVGVIAGLAARRDAAVIAGGGR